MTLALRQAGLGNNAKPLEDIGGQRSRDDAFTDAGRVAVTNNTDNTVPTVAFSPANGARTNAKSGEHHADLQPSPSTRTAPRDRRSRASDLDSLIELKLTDDNGSAIGFAASIDAANTVVTVNPSADLADGDVYVEVGRRLLRRLGQPGRFGQCHLHRRYRGADRSVQPRRSTTSS